MIFALAIAMLVRASSNTSSRVLPYSTTTRKPSILGDIARESTAAPSGGMAVLSIITGGGKWVEISIAADPLYQHLLLTAEKKFWRCVTFGEPPRLFGVEPPRPRIEGVRVVDMGASNSWAEFAAVFRLTRSGFVEHERAKAELKGLMPEDAKEAFGHGIRAKRSKSGAVSFEVTGEEASHAPLK